MSEQLEINGYEIPYFHHHYNCGMEGEACTERSLEIAIASDWYDCVGPIDLLEVGCVTPHYDLGHHTVVDLYEKHPRAMNVDADSIDYTDRYVMAISTLEHVKTCDNRALLSRILDQCKQCCITVPGGFRHHKTADQYAKNLEQWLLDNHDTIPADVMMFSRKEDIRYWHEVDIDFANVQEYGIHHRNANTVFIIIK
jgi:hypothetical protein